MKAQFQGWSERATAGLLDRPRPWQNARMLRKPLAFVLMVLSAVAVAKGHGGVVHVRGHTTRSGTYVMPHTRTGPDSSKVNNWSTKGNSNPYTGKAGTKK